MNIHTLPAIVATALLCLALAPRPCSANSVSNTVTHATYSSVADALDALTADGQTLVIAPGVYTEPELVVGYAVTLSGTDAATTILQPADTPGTASSRVLTVYIPVEFVVSLPVVIENLTLRNGNTSGAGGAVYVQEGTAQIRNCVLSENAAGGNGGAAARLYSPDASLAAEDSIFYVNHSDAQGGGLYGASAVRCTFSGNTALNGGGAAASALIDCSATSNTADSQGGGLFGCTGLRCIVTNNAALFGGGIYSAALANSLLAKNAAGQSGGAVYMGALTNCTVAANTAATAGGGLSSGEAVNTLFADNAAPEGADYANATLAYCCAEPLAAGPGNIADAPVFWSAAGSDYALLPGSPCIDAGDSSAAPAGNDLAGNTRIQGGTVDIGAYESDPSAAFPAPTFAPASGALFTNSLDVVLACSVESATIRYTLDGSDPTADSPVYTIPLLLTESALVKARAFLSGYTNSAVTSASYTRSISLAEALDATNLVFATGGHADWTVVTNVTHASGLYAVRSGAVSDPQSTWIETTLTGIGALSFWWKVSCEDNALDAQNHLNVVVDGVEQSRIAGEVDWSQLSISLTAGVHTVRWTYLREGTAGAGQDCAWMDNVTWTTATRTTPVAVPFAWLDTNRLAPDGDFETAALSDTDGDGQQAWQEYVAGTSPTNPASVFLAVIRLENEQPTITWTPDLGAARTYSVKGKADIGAPSWSSPTNADSRFFRVEVGMP